MEEVLELQQKIEEIGYQENNRTESKGLEKICFAPMTPTGREPILKECVVQSVLGYFGNSREKLHFNYTDADGFTVNYLNTLHKCLA